MPDAAGYWVTLKSTTEHTEYTEPERQFFSVISVALVVIPTGPGETDPLLNRIGH